MATGIVCAECRHRHARGAIWRASASAARAPLVYEDCFVCDGSGNYPGGPSDGYMGPCPECRGSGRCGEVTVSLRDELRDGAAETLTVRCYARGDNEDSNHAAVDHESDAEAVLDSIPPNTFKDEKGEWQKVESVPACEVGRLSEHWEDCPLPPDANCIDCHRYAGKVYLVPVLDTEVDG